MERRDKAYDLGPPPERVPGAQKRDDMEGKDVAGKVDADASEELYTISGYAAVFNSPTMLTRYGEQFQEVIMPGAFDAIVKDTAFEMYAMNEHDMLQILAKRSVGTCRVSIDDTGLFAEVDIPDTSYGDDVITNYKAGNITGFSIGWDDFEDRWDFTERLPVRRLFAISCIDISTTCCPAYEDAEILDMQLRSLHAAWEAARGEKPFMPNMETIRRRLKVRENELKTRG